MFFKNLRLYRLTEGWALPADELSAKLAEREFQPCDSLDVMKYGFVPPLGDHGTDFVHAANGYIMICAKRQEKIMPGGVVNEQLEEKARAISEAEQRIVGRKERQTLKDEIIFSLLPKAFTKSSLDYAYIDTQGGLIVVNAASGKRAEDLLSALREALGSLRCIPLTVKNIPTQVMTHWLRDGELPHQFELGETCELQAGKDGRIIRAKNQDLSADEVRNHLDSGMFVSKVALTWNEAIHCVVDEHLAIKSLKFEDKLLEKANDRNPESKAEQFDADFVVMTLELKHFIDALLAGFGGIDSSMNEETETKSEPKAAAPLTTSPVETSEGDPFYPQAVAFVKSSGRVTISAIQREMRIGYNHAARIMERMESEGVVTPANQSGVSSLVSVAEEA